jgi:ketosteroid isomerase-like protein
MQQPSQQNISHQISEERAVQQVLAQYTRAVDALDGTALSALFCDDGKVEVYYVNAGVPEQLFILDGKAAIANAISNLMAPHPERGWSHHTTHDHIISVTGDKATIDAQFIRFDAVGAARPKEGWPAGTIGLMGAVKPTESGYYRPSFVKINGGWKIATHKIYHDLPFALPGE